MKKIVTVIGTRPEIIKMFPLIKELDKKFDNKLIFSGQHFNKEMKNIFFKEFKLRNPDISINIINKTNFLNELYIKLSKTIKKISPDAVLYHGDTYTTLVSALICKINFPEVKSIHIESGYRSKDTYPIEERIRKIVDNISNINFTIRKNEKKNLQTEGVKKHVYTVGNTITDSIRFIKKKLKKNNPNKYVYITIHRAENVDIKNRLKSILNLINIISNKINIILSIHPRTIKMIKRFKLSLNKDIKVIKPTNYLKNLNFLYNSTFCITDSGGLQEEAIILRKKCFIPCKSTPHIGYLGKHSNELLNVSKPEKLFDYIKKPTRVKKFKFEKNVSKKICKIIKKII